MTDLEVLLNKGFSLHQKGSFDYAEIIYKKIIAIQPNNFDALQLLGLLLGQNGRYLESVKFLSIALEINPNHVVCLNNIGNALKELNRFQEAVDKYNKALRFQPNYVDALINRGLALRELNCFEEALSSYNEAILLEPNKVEAFNNRGVCFMDLLLLDKGIINFNIAISIKPYYANAHWNLSLCYLLCGDLKNGFLEYEWRWESKNQKGSKRVFQNPLWLGDESLLNKTILIYGEQGLGDMIQFCRYIEMLASLGANIVLEVPSSLHQLMKSLKGVSQVVTTGEILPYFDYQCPMMSLPLAFKTELATIPAKIPYLSAPEEKKQYWQRHLGSHSKLRVGLVWSGGVRLDRPELWTVNNRRNIPLQKLTQLQHPKIQFYSLQKGDAAESELRELRENNWAGPDILDFTGDLIDFADTAALIDNLDLIISVDTSIVHLAGALGKPVWVLNRYDSCWRWLIDRNDSPWYPTLKLYRQESYGNWDGVIIEICNDLSNYCKNFTSNS